MPKRANPLVRRVDTQNRVSLPEEVRARLGLAPDDFVIFDVHEGHVRIRRARIVADSPPRSPSSSQGARRK